MPSSRVLITASLLVVAFTCSAGETRVDSQVELGRKLFEQGWLRPPADDSPAAVAPGGDGLGPLFNGASCAECHKLGGVGGAGPNEHNVEIVSLALPLDTPPDRLREAMQQAKRTHPEFLRETSIFLHHFGRDESGSLRPYAEFRDLIRSEFPPEVLPASQTERALPDGLPYQLAQRNTPALFGAGLIESIKPGFIRAVARLQQKRFPDLAGIPSDDGAGRYGWRGHVPTLDRFVRTACAEELGMRVPREDRGIHDQPPWPVDGYARVPRTSPSPDLSEDQVLALVTFVRSLPRPEQVLPEDSSARAEAEAGQVIFAEIGCAVCHVRDMGHVAGIYSDMLLHDMGKAFADRVAAPLDVVPPQVRSETHIQALRSQRVNYAGVSTTLTLVPTTTTTVFPPSLNDLTKATQAFRTPALWGVADSGPYLHDGRAETLDDAIRLHDGQSKPIADRYAALPSYQQTQLLAFLGTLRAPQTDSIVADRSRPAALRGK